MEYLPPESEVSDGPPPVLEYSMTGIKPARTTPFYVRVISVVMSVYSLLLGFSLIKMEGLARIKFIARSKNWVMYETASIRFFLCVIILIAAGTYGLCVALRSKSARRRGR